VKITVVGMATLVEANPRSAERFGREKKKKKWEETDSNQGQETPNIGVRLEITTGHMQGC